MKASAKTPAKQGKKQAGKACPAATHAPNLPTSLKTFDRAEAELLGSERSNGKFDLSDVFDPRQEALQAFDLYTAEYDRFVREVNLASEGNRVPIACNFGASGSGKTSQLLLLCRHFRSLHPDAIIIYFTLNGKNADATDVDRRRSMADRIALRILQGVIPVSSAGKYGDFYAELKKATNIPKGLLDHLPGLLRQLYGADLKTPILIAADELRKFGKEPPIGKTSRVAVHALKVLALLSQNAAKSARLKAGGPAYIAASAMAAYDPVEGITEGSSRSVYYMPPPPLRLHHYEAELAKERNSKARTIKRMLLWLNQSNARALAWRSKGILSDKSPTEKYQEALSVRRNDFSESVVPAAKAAGFNLIEFLRSLFFPLTFNRITTRFNCQMRSALLGDAAGLCTLLRSTNPDFDSVYVHPVALSGLLAPEVLGLVRQPIPPATVAMLQTLCTKLVELPVFPTDGASHGVGKLYEEVVTLGYASKALLLRKGGTTVHEFLFGRQPPLECGRISSATGGLQILQISRSAQSRDSLVPPSGIPNSPNSFTTPVAVSCPPGRSFQSSAISTMLLSIALWYCLRLMERSPSHLASNARSTQHHQTYNVP